MVNRSTGGWRTWTQRSDVRLGGFGLMAVLAVYLGFIGVDVGPAETFIKRAGYHAMAITFAWWGVVVVRWELARRAEGIRPEAVWSKREIAGVLGGLILAVVIAVESESLSCKVLFDEFVLQSTAFNLHYFREVGTMVRGYDFLGAFISTSSYLDKRPYFFPFLISLAHDLTGYRPINAYLVNVVLLPVGLWLAYLLGRVWHGWRGGALAMGLLGTLPLYLQNATGSGMEMINLVMLLAAVGLGARFLKHADERSLSAFVLTVVLLAQCRYESAIYVLSGGVVIAMVWWRTQRVILSVTAIFVPLMLVPMALHSKVLSQSPKLWELRENQTSRFGLEYVADNLRGAGEFLYSMGPRMANSWLLGVVGTVALLACVGWVIAHGKRWRRFDALVLSWIAFGIGTGANLVVVMFYFWSRFTDPMAARFSFPLYLLMIFAVVAVVKKWDFKRRLSNGLLVAIALWGVGYAVPKQAYHYYSHMGIDEIEWEARYVQSLPRASRLIITNKTTIRWLLEKIPAIHIGRAGLVTDRLAYQLTRPTFSEILVTQTLRPTTANGDYEVVPSDRLPPGYELELLEEKRFGTAIDRVSRLVAIRELLPEGGAVSAASHD